MPGLNRTSPQIHRMPSKKTVDYLNTRPSKVLFISGKFLDAENQPNLGYARGEEIRNQLQSLGLSRKQMVVVGFMDEQLLVDDGKVFNAMDYDIGNIPNFELSVQDGANFSASAPNNLTFEKSQYQIAESPAEEVQSVFQQTLEYLNNTPNRILKITGVYHQSEKK